jgi:quinone-modifying oxidoreductase subunit QmoC
MPPATLIEPDLQFIKEVKAYGGDTLKKCFQCATCSVVCNLSPDDRPFPRKEMIWAQWGLKERLLSDPDVWLCHQCNDCSTYCPRGARPGDVMKAIQRESVVHYSRPSFLGRWMNEPKYLPLLLSIPAVLLGLALLVKAPIENALGMAQHTGKQIIYSTTSMFPHWLLNSFFLFFSALVFIVTIVGVMRFWRALKTIDGQDAPRTPAQGMLQSIVSALKTIITHSNFTKCTTESLRYVSHLCVFFGFIALFVVTLCVVTIRYNPLFHAHFVYPFNFWSPWKILANLGGVALICGCFLMILNRLRKTEQVGTNTFADWAFIWALIGVATSGLGTEFLHYARLEPHRFVAYFIHLVFVFVVLIYLPYTKFAHLIYRPVAMIYAEYFDRKRELSASVVVKSGQTSMRIEVRDQYENIK